MKRPAQIGDAGILMSDYEMRSSKHHSWDRIEGFCSPERLLWPVRPEGLCEAYNVEVVACDIFATHNSLKSHAGRKLKSPFSNVRAITSKLCSYSRPTAIENRLPLRLRAALKSP